MGGHRRRPRPDLRRQQAAPLGHDHRLALGGRALPAPFIGRLLRARLPFGRELMVVAQGTAIRFRPAETFSAEPDDGTLDVGVPPAGLARLADAIRSRAGRVEVDTRLTIEIVPTIVRDAHGDPTGEVVG